MSKSVLLALTLPLVLTGCPNNGPQYFYIDYPVMTLSQAQLEFGEADWGGSVERTLILSNDGGMPMGVGTIEVGDAAEGSPYTVAWNTGSIECPAAAGDTGGATAKGIDVDTGGPEDSGGPDTGGDTGGGGVLVEGALFVLDPGCQIELSVTYTPNTAGDAYDALRITSVGLELTDEEKEAGQDLPAYKEDPVHTTQVVYLHGESEYAQGSVVVRPRSYDFGFVHPDAAQAEEPARIQISNVGDGDVTILGTELSSSCDPLIFSPQNFFPDGLVLEGGESTLTEVTFTPDDTNASYCQLTVLTDDIANPEIEVTLTGNSGTDPDNQPPTVYIREPDNGYRYNAIRPLELELNVFDVNQPATSLICKVKSAVLQNVTLADCTPTDESGHVFVSIAADDLDSGVDTLLVTVTDGSETSAYASVSVLINADYPEDDDDGDGYSVNGDEDGENVDCDDDNILTYPKAAEVYDGEDNDCDEQTDENTVGGDDDGDGVSEIDGDCNDYSNDVYPGAPERADGMDNDCDGTSDESTSLYDDDGDGYAEVNNDCDDNDASVNPSATEVCDGVDNNCNGLRDSNDGCAATDTEPVVAGNSIRMEQSACLEGETITMSALATDADGDVLTYLWSVETPDDGTFDNPSAQTVNYTCPTLSEGLAGKVENIYLVITDDDGNTDWVFEKITVWDSETELYEPYTRVVVTDDAASCATTGGAPGALLVVGAGLALAARRRR